LDPVVTPIVASTVAGTTVVHAGETAAVTATTAKATGTAASLLEGAEIASKANETLGLASQLETIQHGSLESLIAKNESSFQHFGIPNQLDVIHSNSLESIVDRNDVLLSYRNADLAGMTHPETNVHFHSEIIHLPDGQLNEGVFPEFNSVYDANLPDDLLKATDYKQSTEANKQLADVVDSSEKLNEQFTDRQLEQIHVGDTPEGFTWHHHQESGRMQLVDSDIHRRTGHTGGKEIWGGGRP
jgi:hypothetical protein